MEKKIVYTVLCVFCISALGGCAKYSSYSAHASTAPPSTFTDDVAANCTHIDSVLNKHHNIDATVTGGDRKHLDSFTLAPLSISVDDALGVFAPEDTGTYSIQETEEGYRLISEAGNRCYISPYRIMFEKEEEIQKKKNNEIMKLLEFYAQENPNASKTKLDFINQTDAVSIVEGLLNKLGINMKPILQTYAAMTNNDIMNYQQKLVQRDAESEDKYYDPFDKAYLLNNLNQTNDACFISFTFAYEGIPIYHGTPSVSYIAGVVPPYPATLSVLISRQGLQVFDGMGLYHVEKSDRSSDIITANIAADLYRQKYDLVIQPQEEDMRVSSIYLEYIPIVGDMGTVLTPYWCFPIEVNYPSGWIEVSSERFNAFTGEDITYGG